MSETPVKTGGRTRRTVVGGALVGTAGAALAACATPGAQPTQPAASTQPATLEYWTWHGTDRTQQYERMLEAFKKHASHLTINWVGVGGTLLEKVTVAAAGGTPPDMAYMDNQHQGFFGKNKFLIDQAPLAKKEKDFRVDAIDPRALGLYTYDGIQLGYPWAITTAQIFFNRDLFRAAGQTTPDELYKQGRWNWDTLAQTAVALTKRDGGEVTQIGIAQMAVWRLAIQSNGGDYFDDPRRPKKSRLDEPRAIAAIEYIRDLTHKHRAGWRNEDAARLGGGDIMAYDTQKAAMCLRHGVHGRFPQVAAVTGIVPWPKGPDSQGKPVTDLTTEAAGIMRASKQQDPAWQFCRWYHKDWQREILASATPPDARVASRSDLQDVARKALPPPVEDWYEMTKLGLLSRAVNPDWNKMTAEIFNPGLNPVWAGERAPREAALDVSQKLNDFLAANPQ